MLTVHLAAETERRTIRISSQMQTILNNLQSQLPNGKAKKENILAALAAANVDPTRRGETLSIEEFGHLADELHPYFN